MGEAKPDDIPSRMMRGEQWAKIFAAQREEEEQREKEAERKAEAERALRQRHH